MIAAPAQLFNEFGKDAPYASPFRLLFSHVRALDYEIAQSRSGIQI